MLLAPFDSSLRDYNLEPKRPRYYQRIAVNRALRAIARGQRRILLTLATGTGKTMVALQLVAKLRKAGWTAGRMPRVLYLADRNILLDQPKDDYFVPAFKDVVHKISKGHAQRSREVYFALYQSLEQGDEQALFTQYEKDYYDLIIVDECHRGSAGSSSQWRGILDAATGRAPCRPSLQGLVPVRQHVEHVRSDRGIVRDGTVSDHILKTGLAEPALVHVLFFVLPRVLTSFEFFGNEHRAALTAHAASRMEIAKAVDAPCP
ncbi:MAG: DEAD/DEAH box helicase family protein [Pseudonocardiaceae bacterium]